MRTTDSQVYSSPPPEVYQGPYAVTILRPDGVVVYRNVTANILLGQAVQVGASITAILTSPSDWDLVMARLAEGAAVVDEPVLLQTIHSDTDIAYLTIYPEQDENGEIVELVCLWSSHKERITTSPENTDVNTLSQYVHDLEKMIEHRAYQQVLTAEQNEFLSEVAETLPLGLVVATIEGDVVYRNRAMMEDFGLRASDQGRPNIRYFLSRDVCDMFAEVGRTGLRRCLADHDPLGQPVDVDLLPLIRAGEARHIVILFSRPGDKGVRS